MIKQVLAMFLVSVPFFLNAQINLVTGTVLDPKTNAPLEAVRVETDLDATTTDANGYFELELPPDVEQITFRFSHESGLALSQEVSIEGSDVTKLGNIVLSDQPSQTAQSAKDLNIIPIISINEEELEGDNQSENISGLLTASRDPFVSAAAFTFGPLRFRIRGLDSEYTRLYMNGVPMNELENGRIYWSQWGGLNDVFRNRQTSIGLAPADYGFGGVGGNGNIDTRASKQRKQTRVSYARSNRSYNNRVMITHSSGVNDNGFSYSVSGSRRWAEEGYIDGTFYDAWSYFGAVEKQFNKNHSLSFTAFGAPSKRGRSAASMQELYDLAGTNFYNPNWGWQDGKKRNSRVGTSHQPMGILRHDWNLGDKTSIVTAVSYQQGRNGTTRLDWFDAADPRPDYYRKLPSFAVLEDSTQAALLREKLIANPELLQVDWNTMYQANYNSDVSIENANGEGTVQEGKFAQYIVEEQRFDSKELGLNTTITHNLNDNITLNGGLSYQAYEGENYRKVVDLLGGDFRVDWDQFAIRDIPDSEEARDSDIRFPNRIIREGDRFGYDYNSYINKGTAWAQAQFSYKKLDFHVSGELVNTTFWRVGNMQNGRFPDNSLGKSVETSLGDYGVKAGATYKINNKNYLFANGGIRTQAPFFRVAYVSPRTRDQVVPNIESETITSIEGGYVLNGPSLKLRATGYLYKFDNGTDILRFYNDFLRAFGSYVLTNIDRRHAGVELAGQVKINSTLSASAVAALGQNIYTSRQTANIYQDDGSAINAPSQDLTIYSEGFFVDGTPQSAYTFGLNYNSPKFWFASLNVNYLDGRYIGFSPDRRRVDAVYDLDNAENPDLYDEIVNQTKVDPTFTVDIFAGKSWIFDDKFLYLNVGLNNILNNTNNITGGFEQLRLDLDELQTSGTNTFEPRYYYGYGMNFFASVTLRM